MSGQTDEAKGRVKKAAGELLDDDEMRSDGERDEQAGKAKQAVDRAAEKVQEGIDNVKDRLS